MVPVSKLESRIHKAVWVPDGLCFRKVFWYRLIRYTAIVKPSGKLELYRFNRLIGFSFNVWERSVADGIIGSHLEVLC